ncbi:glutamate 5-kinase [Algicella marina]|uniref:Glutamate 5-kinase n=1 Tax=Algicella marina TaxID=2683284 RepID=A0A6P1T694_9RHOB|nr:glutamate 5-kinase [Algicella marina]QHQ37331.1 glutamate 5-kinase [Algicella marina]
MLSQARRIVIKVGSALLVDQTTGNLRRDWLAGLVADVAALRSSGKDVLLVSSGSIALGRRQLGLPAGALALEQSQAAAAVGQIQLAHSYSEGLASHGIRAAQVLVTLEDSENRRRYLNSRATLATLLDLGAVPVVNENDTVATDEIRYGDNDRLAAQVSVLSGADVLILLSDVDGLYTADPRKNTAATHIPFVTKLTHDIMASAGGAASETSRGGMKTKLLAAEMALQAGCSMVITKGDVIQPLSALANGAKATWFRSDQSPKAARKQWIAAMKARGEIRVDDGAVAALGRGKSLLVAGVTGVTGDFMRGDPVEITGPAGQVLARGLAGYDAVEARLIQGCKSSEIEARLGHPGRAALVHRDDMVI